MKALVFTMAWMVLGMTAFAQDAPKPAVHDAKNPGLDRSGFLPYPRRDHVKKDGILEQPPEDPVEHAKWLKAVKERRDAKQAQANGGVMPPKGEVKLPKGVYRPGMNEFRGHYYQAFKAPGISWTEARKKCEEMGGHLATITDTAASGNGGIIAMAAGTDENQAVSGSKGEMERAWIGAYREGMTWKWVTSEMWRSRNWVDGDKMGKNDIKGLGKAQDERKRLISEAEAKKVEFIANAKAKADEYVAKADGKKDVYVERAKKKAEDVLWAANQEGDRLILEAKQQGGLAVLKETGVKIPPACVSSGRKSPDGKTEAPMTVDELKNAVKSIEGLAVVDDRGFLNNMVGDYGYMVERKWNARFDDGGWMAKGEIPDGMAIEGFVCEWESKDDIKKDAGMLAAPPKDKSIDPIDLINKRMDADPEFKAKCEAQKAEWQKKTDEEKANVSPTGKYKVTVVHPKTKEPKTFECEAENSWDAKQKVLKGLVDKFEKAGKKGELMGCTCSVAFAE